MSDVDPGFTEERAVRESKPCRAVLERRALIRDIRSAADPQQKLEVEGTEGELADAMAVLVGIVAEYRDGGDQMVEGCTCGKHTGEEVRASNGS